MKPIVSRSANLVFATYLSVFLQPNLTRVVFPNLVAFLAMPGHNRFFVDNNPIFHATDYGNRVRKGNGNVLVSRS